MIDLLPEPVEEILNMLDIPQYGASGDANTAITLGIALTAIEPVLSGYILQADPHKGIGSRIVK